MKKFAYRAIAIGILLVAGAIAAHEGAGVALAAPFDPNPGCSFPSNAVWVHCWATPYSNIFTQAWIGPFEEDQTYGWHHNLHFQPSGAEYTDYMNLHIYFDGIFGSGGGSQYTWRIWCSDSSGYRQCGNWNNNEFDGQIFEVSMTSCPGADKYTCADYAAGNFTQCLITYPQCNYSFVNANFPGAGNYLVTKDGYGDSGTIQNAFCDALNQAGYYCADR